MPTLGHAVFVAGHEGMHLRGIANETEADCATWRCAVLAPEVPQCR